MLYDIFEISENKKIMKADSHRCKENQFDK